MASYRLRAKVAADRLNELGIQASINTGEADVLVISKPDGVDIPMAQAAKKEGCRIVVDICDDHYQHSKLGPQYIQIAKLADVLVSPTAEMARRTKEATGCDSAVICDPYEQEEQTPHAEGETLLWFGHQTNLGDLNPYVKMLGEWNLRVATGPAYPVPEHNKWGKEAVGDELKASNVVFLPSRKGAEYKSNNRLLNAIRGGCFAVCARHPAHIEFRKLLWVGEVMTGLTWAKANMRDLNDLVRAAQDYIRDRYSRASIGDQWASLLRSV